MKKRLYWQLWTTLDQMLKWQPLKTCKCTLNWLKIVKIRIFDSPAVTMMIANVQRMSWLSIGPTNILRLIVCMQDMHKARSIGCICQKISFHVLKTNKVCYGIVQTKVNNDRTFKIVGIQSFIRQKRPRWKRLSHIVKIEFNISYANGGLEAINTEEVTNCLNNDAFTVGVTNNTADIEDKDSDGDSESVRF